MKSFLVLQNDSQLIQREVMHEYDVKVCWLTCTELPHSNYLYLVR